MKTEFLFRLSKAKSRGNEIFVENISQQNQRSVGATSDKSIIQNKASCHISE